MTGSKEKNGNESACSFRIIKGLSAPRDSVERPCQRMCEPNIRKLSLKQMFEERLWCLFSFIFQSQDIVSDYREQVPGLDPKIMNMRAYGLGISNEV